MYDIDDWGSSQMMLSIVSTSASIYVYLYYPTNLGLHGMKRCEHRELAFRGSSREAAAFTACSLACHLP